MKYICGIDCGVTGAISFMNPEKKINQVFDMPTKQVIVSKKVRNRLDPKQLYEFLLSRKRDVEAVYIETVHAMPQQGVTSTFSFGEAYGILQGCVQVIGCPVRFVRPQEWKKHYGLASGDKAGALTMAQYLFGKEYLSLKKHHNRAEALLIGQYAIDKLIGENLF